ncbi:MAG: energy-coupling factor ABC transporter ATP-binding protein [Candidatus Bathyarchaeum sp.]|nr:MAG: energy-coupling factor ABC transporter ATP-binding protein [Candidatus Bathyarchaeum sp.]
MKAIQIKNVTYTYPLAKKPVIQDFSLEINSGEFVGIIGGTGAGKTTLFRLINGLIPHYFRGKLKGDVFVDGLNTKSHPVGELATSVGIVFQEVDSQLFFQTVEDDVAFGPENLCVPHDEIVRRVDGILEKAGLTELRYKSPNNLSEGQKQLVAIASVLAMKPKVLLLDEPTSNLDSESAERVISFLKELNREGITVLLATHDLDVLVDCATRIVLLNDGQIQVNGTPNDVFSKGQFFQSLGLGLPQIPLLFQKLVDSGFDFEKTPLTVSEAFELIVMRLNA